MMPADCEMTLDDYDQIAAASDVAGGSVTPGGVDKYPMVVALCEIEEQAEELTRSHHSYLALSVGLSRIRHTAQEALDGV